MCQSSERLGGNTEAQAGQWAQDEEKGALKGGERGKEKNQVNLVAGYREIRTYVGQ